MGDNNYISYQEENGSINISEEVVSAIVRAAAVEVDGVASLSTTAGTELAELLGLKTIPKGVSIRFENNQIVTDIIINVTYGSNVVSVARTVQAAVKSVIQDTTGFVNAEVNVHVAGISFDR